MELEKIWKTYNISFVLVLPIFNFLFKNIKTKTGHKLSIYTLCSKCGLLNTYLLNKNGNYDNCLKLVFDSNKLLEADLSNDLNKPVTNFLEILISSEFFITVSYVEKYIIVYMKIDQKWDEDIYHIINSQYSRISSNYFENILHKGVYFLSEDPIINYIYINNIPAKIIKKHEDLEKKINLIFNSDLKLSEVFSKFDIEKESFLLKKLI